MMIVVFAIVILLMIFIPVGLAVVLRRRVPVPWWLFCVGVATFVGAQLVHFPLNEWLVDRGVLRATVGADATLMLQTALVAGFSAGLMETTARVVGYIILFRAGKAQRVEDGIMVGLGHGGIEAMLFGGVATAAVLTSLSALRGVDLTTLSLSPAQLEVLRQQMEVFDGSPLLALAPLLERGIALGLHVALSLLVWYAFKRKNGFFVLLALAYHTGADATAVFVANRMQNAWAIEAVVLLTALPGLAWIWWLWRRTAEERVAAWAASRMPLQRELSLLAQATRKELLQLWRTRRLLVVAATFLFFGLTSPLLARYTPELLSNIEGAEQFADLIPTPTRAESLAQYMQYITQFGFIIVILMGMGAVAGEKERGTAAMILSKPLPRWAFVMSKFVAQAVAYGVGMLLAAAGAFYYTLVLFEPFAFAPFMLGNLLLLFWLLTYSAVTLLASTVARSNGTAAALAFAGAVLLLLSGSLPRIGPLAPSGLVAWASQLGISSEVTANGGALVAALVIIVVALLLAVAIFEQEEI